MFGKSENPGDQFSAFWSDAVARMTHAGTPNPFQSTSEDAMKHMRRAFFDSWSKSCEEYLGSEAFLESMKKSMDDGLIFKQQVNEFMSKALSGVNMPSREDTESIMEALRSMEARVLSSVEDVSNQMKAVEQRVSALESMKKKSTKKRKDTAS